MKKILCAILFLFPMVGNAQRPNIVLILADDLGAEPQFHPNQRGFDEFYGLLGGSRSYFALDNPDHEIAIERNGAVEKDPPGSYMTDRLTDSAIDYINAHAARKIKQPFFMYLSYTAPHGPLDAKPGYAERFSDIKSEKRRAYAGLVASLDEGVGRVLECLDINGLEQDTLIVFLSDNGGPTDHNASWNGPLKGAKGSLWEGGVRVPFFMQWTGKIPAGQVIDEPVSSLDLLPSFGAAAGVKYTIDTDGINLWPYLGGTGNKIPDRTIFWRRGDKTSCALRQGQYKWVENRRTDEQWLFDIEADLSEKNNLLSVLPEMAETMKRTHIKWEASVPDPSFSSEWKPKKKTN